MSWPIAGIIEGFYGRPWSWDERAMVMRACHGWGMDTYVYAPKDDPKHRERWRDPYGSGKLDGFARLAGEGTLRVAGERVPIKAGDVITIPPGPDYPHHIINTSDAPLHYLSISTTERPEVCEYPDSGKVGIFTPGLRYLQKRDAGVDYWEGEP